MVYWLMLGHTIYIGNGKIHDSGLVGSGLVRLNLGILWVCPLENMQKVIAPVITYWMTNV